jgi:uncharacterized membrane protein
MIFPLTSGANRSVATHIGEDGTILGSAAKGTDPLYTPFRPARRKPGKVGERLPIRKFPGFGGDIAGRTKSGEIWVNFSGDYDSHPMIFRKGRAEFAPLPHRGANARVLDANQFGMAVGGSTGDEENDFWHQGIYWTERTVHRLDALLAPGSGYVITNAFAINDDSWIVGEAELPDGSLRNVLLQPIDNS